MEAALALLSGVLQAELHHVLHDPSELEVLLSINTISISIIMMLLFLYLLKVVLVVLIS